MSTTPTPTNQATNETESRIVAAATNWLTVDAKAFDQVVKAARRLAAADAASKASGKVKSEAAATASITTHGVVRTFSAATYSKLCKVGRATDDQVTAFVKACDSPTWDKFYNALPKNAAMSKPRATKPAATKPAAPAAPAVKLTEADAPRIARELVAALRTRGADLVTINLVISEMDRLTTPVASVKAA